MLAPKVIGHNFLNKIAEAFDLPADTFKVVIEAEVGKTVTIAVHRRLSSSDPDAAAIAIVEAFKEE